MISKAMHDIGVVVIVFNRPDAAKQLLMSLEKVKPEKLFVISDGARDNRAEEANLVKECRNVFNQVSWDCEIHTNYSGENLGVRKRIASGIDWVFSIVDKAIILEDDCIPTEDFFLFSANMLKKFENDKRITSITGTNFFESEITPQTTYFFSKYHSCWGWATWKRAWELFDNDLKIFDDQKFISTYLESYLDSKRESTYWLKILKKLRDRKIDSWAYIWSLSNYMNQTLQIVPNVNLIENIGFSESASHTRVKPSHVTTKTSSLEQVYQHPEYVCFYEAYDRIRRDRVFSKSLYYKILRGFSLIKEKLN